MMLCMPNAANSTESMVVRQMKLLGNMLGAEIDFVILGIDSKTRSVVASRREAMMRKRQLFYFSPDANGEYRVREGRVVQARVIAVADKSIRKRPRPAPAAALNPCRLCWNPLHRILLYWEIPCN